MCVCACVRAAVRACGCVCACVRACVCVGTFFEGERGICSFGRLTVLFVTLSLWRYLRIDFLLIRQAGPAICLFVVHPSIHYLIDFYL